MGPENQEKSAALKFADDLEEKRKADPGEGEMAERHEKLGKNMRRQGLLTTWYYRQATTTKEIPFDEGDPVPLSEHRADWMIWQPEAPQLKAKFWEIWGDAVDWAAQEVLKAGIGQSSTRTRR